ncbi:hypothetical protein BUALT_Bualt11G0093600 [Buddleja alternifolia]|uniref:Uncharacterized protein n=1 Tax=Buddleja alternifolia TaxID=168488 RepID=A0AAV6X4K4_9LAMI|nr:hypothetical protein BUALT_Bualt11G0093600 [Buddleja alternifolia]
MATVAKASAKLGVMHNAKSVVVDDFIQKIRFLLDVILGAAVIDMQAKCGNIDHSGLVEEGLRLFSLMQEGYRVRPDMKRFTSVVDLFGLAGKLDQVMPRK